MWSEPTFRELISRIVEQYNKEAVKENWARLEYFCPDQSRHTYTSAAYNAGLDMKTVSHMLGHESDSVTLNVYTHLSKEKEKEQEAISKYMQIS